MHTNGRHLDKVEVIVFSSGNFKHEIRLSQFVYVCIII